MNNLQGEWKQTGVEHTLIKELPTEAIKNKYHCRCLSWFLWDATEEEAVKQHTRHVKKVT